MVVEVVAVVMVMALVVVVVVVAVVCGRGLKPPTGLRRSANPTIVGTLGMLLGMLDAAESDDGADGLKG